MKPVAVLAIILIVIGVIALAYGGFSFTTREKVRPARFLCRRFWVYWRWSEESLCSWLAGARDRVRDRRYGLRAL